jgi:hypothetical protein
MFATFDHLGPNYLKMLNDSWVGNFWHHAFEHLDNTVIIEAAMPVMWFFWLQFPVELFI